MLFDLNNKTANHQIHVQFGGREVRNNTYPKYLKVLMNRTLMFRKYLVKLSAKLRIAIV